MSGGRVNYEDALETLKTMFGGLDMEIIEDLLITNRGAMEPTIEQLLSLTGGLPPGEAPSQPPPASPAPTAQPVSRTQYAPGPYARNAAGQLLNTNDRSHSSASNNDGAASSQRPYRTRLPPDFLVLPSASQHPHQHQQHYNGNARSRQASEVDTGSEHEGEEDEEGGTEQMRSDEMLARLVQNELFLQAIAEDPELEEYIRNDPTAAASLGLPRGYFQSLPRRREQPNMQQQQQILQRQQLQQQQLEQQQHVSQAFANEGPWRMVQQQQQQHQGHGTTTHPSAAATAATARAPPGEGMLDKMKKKIAGLAAKFGKKNGPPAGGAGFQPLEQHDDEHGAMRVQPGFGSTTSGAPYDHGDAAEGGASDPARQERVRVARRSGRARTLVKEDAESTDAFEIELTDASAIPRPHDADDNEFGNMGSHANAPSSGSPPKRLGSNRLVAGSLLPIGSNAPSADHPFAIDDDEDEEASLVRRV